MERYNDHGKVVREMLYSSALRSRSAGERGQSIESNDHGKARDVVYGAVLRSRSAREKTEHESNRRHLELLALWFLFLFETAFGGATDVVCVSQDTLATVLFPLLAHVRLSRTGGCL